MVKRMGLANVRFIGRVPSDEVWQYAALANASLANMADDPVFSQTIPLTTYLSNGRHVRAPEAEVVK